MAKLTLAKAADIYEATTKQIETLGKLRAEAEAVLQAGFERTGKAAYGNVGWFMSKPRTILDQAAATAHLTGLGRLEEFQKKTTSSRKLRLLEP